MDIKIIVNEIFYSLQGEGFRVGTPTIFIRLQGCKSKYACLQKKIKCDTEFESGTEMSLKEIETWCEKNAFSKEITWTGGEPTDQLNEDIVQYFKKRGYFQAIETSGLNSVPNGIDYISLSPKVGEHVLKKNFPKGVNELRYVRHSGQSIPSPLIKANNYYLSPHSDGVNINRENLHHCIKLIKNNPLWKLSVQQHKIWNIL